MKFNDIINLPHHISDNHPQMSLEARSAQFAPFAALTGYSEAVKETARLTDEKMENDEDLIEILNRKLQLLEKNIKDRPLVTITYFLPDNKKHGGKYVDITSHLKRIDTVEEKIILTDNTNIPINDIINISSKIINEEYI